MTAWARSATFGPVALGPAQADVLTAVRELTRGHRRPYVTLARLSRDSGRPVSSVHDALGRLRALDLIGCAATMGRHGGHRLWSIVAPVRRRSLDLARHRSAVARLAVRWRARPPTATGRTTVAQGPGDDLLGGSDPPGPPDPAAGSSDPREPAEPPAYWHGVPRETFAEKMRRHGLDPGSFPEILADDDD